MTLLTNWLVSYRRGFQKLQHTRYAVVLWMYDIMESSHDPFFLLFLFNIIQTFVFLVMFRNDLRDEGVQAVCSLEFAINCIQELYTMQCFNTSYLKFSEHLCKSCAFKLKVCSLELLDRFLRRHSSHRIPLQFKMQLSF